MSGYLHDKLPGGDDSIHSDLAYFECVLVVDCSYIALNLPRLYNMLHEFLFWLITQFLWNQTISLQDLAFLDHLDSFLSLLHLQFLDNGLNLFLLSLCHDRADTLILRNRRASCRTWACPIVEGFNRCFVLASLRGIWLPWTGCSLVVGIQRCHLLIGAQLLLLCHESRVQLSLSYSFIDWVWLLTTVIRHLYLHVWIIMAKLAELHGEMVFFDLTGCLPAGAKLTGPNPIWLFIFFLGNFKMLAQLVVN